MDRSSAIIKSLCSRSQWQQKLDITYRMAWLRGLKTTYYLRSLAATTTEKSTVADNSLNKVSTDPGAAVPMACSIDDPDCEACQ